MSARRRTFLVALVAVVVLAAVAAGWVVARRGGRSADGVPQDRPGPVLLVPGYGGSTRSLQTLAAALRDDGRAVTVVDLAGDGTGDLRTQAARLRTAARSAVDAGAPSVDVVGYSAGGVIARIWAAELGGSAVARRVVTLGAPQHGTTLAQLGASLTPDACPLACRQLVPGSDLLTALNAGDETPDGPVWTSIWTAQDQTVTPPQSARLDGAVDVEVQGVCPGVRMSHGQLPVDPLVLGLVRQALAVRPLPAAPPPARCEEVRALGGRPAS